jgi:hypothetical protein
MIPMNRLSTTPQVAAFAGPDAIEAPNDYTDFEMGGVALSDPQEGLKAYRWVSWYDPEFETVNIEREGQPSTEVFSAPGLTELSFCFDQNMRPFYAYVQNGQAKFRWYDTVFGGNVITLLNAADYSPKCTLDSKSFIQTTEGLNDIILAYVRGGTLYYRQQRDRFEVERSLAVVGNFRLMKVGMNVINRLQFLLEQLS